jgi:hypothetical protein
MSPLGAPLVLSGVTRDYRKLSAGRQIFQFKRVFSGNPDAPVLVYDGPQIKAMACG